MLVPENLRLWEIVGSGVWGRTKNPEQVIQICAYRPQSKMNAAFDKATMDKARAYFEGAKTKHKGSHNPFTSAQGWVG